MTSHYLTEKKIAKEAVLQAIQLSQQMERNLAPTDIINKVDLSPVTAADFSVQALINLHLLRAFPNDSIMGEENASFLRTPEGELIKHRVCSTLQNLFPQKTAEEILSALDRGDWPGGSKRRFWVLDPIDGTRGFIKKEQYAIALALIENGEVVLGLLGCPHMYQKGALLSATKGEGAYLLDLESGQEHRLHSKSAHQLIYCEPPMDSKSHSHSKAYEIAKLLNTNPESVQLDGQCKYALVAAGEAAMYLRIPMLKKRLEYIWDHAPGMLIVEEAGGRVTDIDGKRFDFSLGTTLAENRGVLATNGVEHQKVIEATAKVIKT